MELVYYDEAYFDKIFLEGLFSAFQRDRVYHPTAISILKKAIFVLSEDEVKQIKDRIESGIKKHPLDERTLTLLEGYLDRNQVDTEFLTGLIERDSDGTIKITGDTANYDLIFYLMARGKFRGEANKKYWDTILPLVEEFLKETLCSGERLDDKQDGSLRAIIKYFGSKASEKEIPFIIKQLNIAKPNYYYTRALIQGVVHENQVYMNIADSNDDNNPLLKAIHNVTAKNPNILYEEESSKRRNHNSDDDLMERDPVSELESNLEYLFGENYDLFMKLRWEHPSSILARVIRQESEDWKAEVNRLIEFDGDPL